MVYRHYDLDQYLNKIEVLEAKIAELESENAQLKEKLRISFSDSREAKSTEALRKAMEKNPEFFMSVKDQKLWKKYKKANPGATVGEWRRAEQDKQDK